MHHIPKPQDQARILENALKEMGTSVEHQVALQLIAKVMGHKNWKTMSAAVGSVPQMAPSVAIPHRLPEMLGPEDGDIYEALVTVDMTLSGRVKVRAYSEDEAKALFGQAGEAQYPHGFELDEGNYRGACDFYLDSDSVENLTGVVREVEFDGQGSYYGSATWTDERFTYKIDVSRDNPDSSDEDEESKATLSITISDAAGNNVSEDFDYEVHNDNLADYLEETLDDGDFDEDIDKLVAKLEEKLSK